MRPPAGPPATRCTWSATRRRSPGFFWVASGRAMWLSPWAPATYAGWGSSCWRCSGPRTTWWPTGCGPSVSPSRAAGREEAGPVNEWARELARRLAGEVRCREPLDRYTSFRIGGPADVFVSPRSVEDIVVVQEMARAAGVPVTIIGGGSNLLVADAGIRGVVVRVGRGLSRVLWDGPRVQVDAGAPLPLLAKEAARR